MSERRLNLARAGRTFRNTFQSKGRKLFGWKFVRDYLGIALTTSQRWGSTEPGTLQIAGCRVEFFNRSEAIFLVHEVFVNATYVFPAVSPAPRIIDCGANIGMATLFFKTLYPSSLITAVEPAKATFELLRHNISMNRLRDVRLVNAALAERPGSIAMDPSPGRGSLVATTADTSKGNTDRIEAITLSSLLDEPADFVKLDVEGAEYGVIRELIASGRAGRIRHLVLEYHDSEQRALELQATVSSLRAAGMHVEQFDDPATRQGILRASVTAPVETDPGRDGRRG
jgi:FkbM family methyltransferase